MKLQEVNELLEEESRKLDEILKPFVLSEANIVKFVQLFSEDLDKGLDAKANAEADMKCFPTYVSRLPTGKERGRYLALDLGGTHFRVLLVNLGDSASPEGDMKFKTFDVPDDLMVGSVYPLFDHVAACIAKFVEEEGLKDEPLPLGFTFSFLCRQITLNNAVLESWSKGFSCDDALGQNVSQLLSDALAKRGDTRVYCVAVINDTTGTLMACAYKEPLTSVGLILGTGTNACYIEDLKKAKLWNRNEIPSDRTHGIINTEWGAFANGGCLDREGIRTDIDAALDAKTNNVGGHIFEKMLSGKYLGEIVRLILCRVYKAGLLFQREDTYAFDEDKGRNLFLTKFMSEIESESNPDFSLTRRVLDELGIRVASSRDCQIVRRVCQTVSVRSARLAGAGIASLLNRMGRDNGTVAVDGSLFRFHPTFRENMAETIDNLLEDGRKFKIVLSTDGSGRGAALVAAAAVGRVS